MGEKIGTGKEAWRTLSLIITEPFLRYEASSRRRFPREGGTPENLSLKRIGEFLLRLLVRLNTRQ